MRLRSDPQEPLPAHARVMVSRAPHLDRAELGEHPRLLPSAVFLGETEAG